MAYKFRRAKTNKILKLPLVDNLIMCQTFLLYLTLSTVIEARALRLFNKQVVSYKVTILYHFIYIYVYICTYLH